MGYILGIMRRASASAKRVFELLDWKSTIVEKPDAKTLPYLEGWVRFENVSFSYDSGSRVLKDIDFTARPGEVVAVVGSTGSGKSTLVHLLPRFYDANVAGHY